jgi:ATP/maltotriose-dependent transcriptional regulator MalT
MAIEQKDGLVMHPEVDEALRYLVKIKSDLTSLAVAKPRLAEANDLAEPGVGFGKLLIKHFNVQAKHFPPQLPEAECVDLALWVYGEPEEFSRRVRSFADKQLLLSELQVLPGEQDVIDVLAEDIASKTHRYEELDTDDLARLCGIEPADGDADRTTYAYWFDIEMQDELHQHFAEMEPYVSPKRFSQLQRWAERIDEMESEFDMKKLTKREQEVLALLWNTDGCSDRSFRAVCSHSVKSRKGGHVTFQFFVGDGGCIEDSCGPYHFKDPGGINCDFPDEIEHPETGNRLCDLLYKPKKSKSS